MAGCDSHTSHVDKKCINTAGALIIELRRLYNHRITQSQQTQTNQHQDPKRPKRYRAEQEFGWNLTFESIVALVLGLETRRHRRRCQRRLQNKNHTATLANSDEPSDVFEYIRLSLVGSAFGCFWRESVSPIDS